jgi:DNA-binding SARP family transcriptional activator
VLTTAGLRVTLLGPVRATLDGVRLELGPARQRAVFAALAARAGRVLSRDEIVDAVWGENAPATAGGSVSTYVCGLRRLLEPDRAPRTAGRLLPSVAGGYLLDIDPDAVDTHRFAARRAEAQRYAAADDPGAAIAAAGRALALWENTPYLGISGPFAHTDRRRLADQRLSTIELRARMMLRLDQDEDLIAELTGLVDEFPLRETLHALLMRALHRRGRTAEALAVYRDTAGLLQRELGVEPGPELRHLHERLRSSNARPAAARLRSRMILEPPEAPATPLLSRDGDLASLDTLLAGVRAGSGGAAWIEGAPGLGKTALLTTALARSGEGLRVAWHTADEITRDVPLRTMLGSLRLGGSIAETEAVAAERIVAHVRSRCAAGPLVLVVDDLHRADDASLRVWARLVAAARRLPLLLLAAARPTPERPELAMLRRCVAARDGKVIDLAPLPDPDIATIAADTDGNLADLVTLADGNPRYAEQMARAARPRAPEAAPAKRPLTPGSASEKHPPAPEATPTDGTGEQRPTGPERPGADTGRTVVRHTPTAVGRPVPRNPASTGHGAGEADLRRRRQRLLPNRRHQPGPDVADHNEQDEHTAYRAATAAGDSYAAARALHARWHSDTARGDDARALAHADEALSLIAALDPRDDGLATLRLGLAGARIRSLQGLDRLAEADAVLHALESGARTGQTTAADSRLPAVTDWHTAAVLQDYWRGRWTAASERLARHPDGDGEVAVVSAGVAALIAVHRDEIPAAYTLLTRTAALPAHGMLLTARAVAAAHRGAGDETLRLLGVLLDTGRPLPAEHRSLLPLLVRTALETGHADLADRAGQTATRVAPDSAVTAHCRALLTGDPDRAMRAADRHRVTGRVVEAAFALEDAAMLLARADRHDDAATVFQETVEAYTRLGAGWDVRRATARLLSGRVAV